MYTVLEGLYHEGIIELKQKILYPENKKIKFIILEDNKPPENNKNDLLFNSFHLGADLDNINLRDYAYEN